MDSTSISDLQREAARRNGAKSRGPKTKYGKARSAMNAFKHGRYARETAVIRGEDRRVFEELVAAYVDYFVPRSPVDLNDVRALADIEWRLRRYRAIDTRVIEHEMDSIAPRLPARTSVLDHVTSAAVSLCERSCMPEFISRKEMRLVQMYETTLKRLRDRKEIQTFADRNPQVFPEQLFEPELAPLNEPETNPAENRPQEAETK